MTFLEAAIEVLRQENGPLEISQITQRAVEQKLLSHVGRDPEAAMRTCLDTASRDSSAGGIVEKDGSRGFRIRPGVKVPEAKVPETKLDLRPGSHTRADAKLEDSDNDSTKKTSDIKGKGRGAKVNSSGTRDAPLRESDAEVSAEVEATESSSSNRRSTAKSRGTARRRTSANKKSVDPPEEPTSTAAAEGREVTSDERQRSLEFSAPTGAGLDGVTDVALVMANAMSRLAGTRPELRHELEAMQQRERAEDEAAETESSEITRGSTREGLRTRKEGDAEERAGRRRRRRRKKNPRSLEVNGAAANGKVSSMPTFSELLDRVAVVLGEAGAKAVHIRQIAENLASQGILGGEVSELERTLTAAIVVDRQKKGAASRFCIRGDSRYQLRDTRLPQALAHVEDELRRSVHAMESETQAQLVRWIEQLGIRGFEALVRCYCEYCGLQILSMPASGRGMVRMIVEDVRAAGEGAMLLLILPRKTQFDLRALGAELERYSCSSAMVFSGTSLVLPSGEEDIRLVSAEQLAKELIDSNIIVDQVQLRVPVINPGIIESIGGLDS